MIEIPVLLKGDLVRVELKWDDALFVGRIVYSQAPGDPAERIHSENLRVTTTRMGQRGKQLDFTFRTERNGFVIADFRRCFFASVFDDGKLTICDRTVDHMDGVDLNVQACYKESPSGNGYVGGDKIEGAVSKVLLRFDRTRKGDLTFDDRVNGRSTPWRYRWPCQMVWQFRTPRDIMSNDHMTLGFGARYLCNPGGYDSSGGNQNSSDFLTELFGRRVGLEHNPYLSGIFYQKPQSIPAACFNLVPAYTAGYAFETKESSWYAPNRLKYAYAASDILLGQRAQYIRFYKVGTTDYNTVNQHIIVPFKGLELDLLAGAAFGCALVRMDAAECDIAQSASSSIAHSRSLKLAFLVLMERSGYTDCSAYADSARITVNGTAVAKSKKLAVGITDHPNKTMAVLFKTDMVAGDSLRMEIHFSSEFFDNSVIYPVFIKGSVPIAQGSSNYESMCMGNRKEGGGHSIPEANGAFFNIDTSCYKITVIWISEFGVPVELPIREVGATIKRTTSATDETREEGGVFIAGLDVERYDDLYRTKAYTERRTVQTEMATAETIHTFATPPLSECEGRWFRTLFTSPKVWIRAANGVPQAISGAVNLRMPSYTVYGLNVGEIREVKLADKQFAVKGSEDGKVYEVQLNINP